jgi:hypothetical protein
MTTPTDQKNSPKGVGLLGLLFGKVQRAPSPPAGLQDRLSFTDKPGSNGTDAAYWQEGDVPDLEDEYFPTVAGQDALLTHWDRPPADQNPQPWYDDRNIWAKQQREKIEDQTAIPWQIETSKPPQMADDPRWNPPTVNRWSAFLSPSSYRFTRPYDQTSEHELNGVHLSLADNRRAYILTGQSGRIRSWNNSYRLDPTSNDATAVFVGDTVINDQSAGTVIGIQASSNGPIGPSYRL